ncbi:MAG: hypothetical protein RSB86_14235 [Comamonas sp.]|jgi:hypothetical protein|uniref:hypothetical protein n=1 Tax=unclassified Comamonas TaxID=2638500 RepID=UPI0017863145|nr:MULTISPECIES: hypothetical protein [unclassified Comamonas]MBD9402393.1 hypothetical protein [Comamonas sp. CMM02]MBP7647336.1 hypothetical protein [Comamonas sp.]MBP9940295.1 hypothetical protein [Comamonas sp.]
MQQITGKNGSPAWKAEFFPLASASTSSDKVTNSEILAQNSSQKGKQKWQLQRRQLLQQQLPQKSALLTQPS